MRLMVISAPHLPAASKLVCTTNRPAGRLSLWYEATPSLTLVAVPSSCTLRNCTPTTGTSLIGKPVLELTSPNTKRSGPVTSSELASLGTATTTGVGLAEPESLAAGAGGEGAGAFEPASPQPVSISAASAISAANLGNLVILGVWSISRRRARQLQGRKWL